ncbi:hypothetical protein SISSUDRAFT_984096 [Sistotremastrum suecicum HHB10207 ss-3]|uniref:Uncharacterized protein n=1 Tax=Sistotremastrum suecicum HHB10207 ss-3 TaxID=1314776 RepID=A0A166ET21_9AGAM|nr:hypothetical protein SISSUDRAFT_984096 [Sistotremastrum suecicum HHB10207 ss-3]
MDSDRRSAVPSFYGGRPSNVNSDARRSTYETPPLLHERNDSSASYHNPQARPSLDRPSLSAGYNRNSFIAPAREEPVKLGHDEEEFVGGQGQEDPWDVYADFNNQGPRYSGAAFANFANQDSGYRKLPPSNSSIKRETTDGGSVAGGNVELVTVPALGPEWNLEEMREMKKSARQQDRRDARARNFKAWWRDQRGCCGGWATRKAVVFFCFGLCVIIGIALAVCIPRVPSFSFQANQPIQPPQNVSGVTNPPNEFSRAPTNFSFPAEIVLEMNTHSNVLPLHFTHLRASIYDLNTLQKVADGDWGNHVVPAKKFFPFTIPVLFNYTAINDTDLTWLDFYNACRNSNQYVNGTRPGVNLKLILDMNIVGLIKTQGSSAQLENVACPFELPTNSV